MAAKPQENPPPVFTTTHSPITERVHEGYEDTAAESGCFRRFCFGWDDGESHNYLLQERSGLHKETWPVDKFKKMKEFSELVAGPKWKNFIRRIGRFCNPRKYKTTPFQYSPESYALNFAGDNQEQEEDDGLMHSFSSRFAPHAFISDQQRRPGL
ncbi:hypothetical protein BUALT_Bualt16G0080400 [Buddleja alternifolia]|uniref:Uncharacterized protein n=1 Tax=Buddleja alternifolia TaxID=168488 RepID=A0AAV6WFD3_9LAMI|nr:hypothetical protein BUALT_Bualt16G0080400 [Buddleja alternifolia]